MLTTVLLSFLDAKTFGIKVFYIRITYFRLGLKYFRHQHFEDHNMLVDMPKFLSSGTGLNGVGAADK